MAVEKLSPGMQQYLDIKKDYPDAFLLFRMGDFYELFYDDAVNAAQILEISLTSRNKNSENPIPMAGVPYHSAQQYIDVLVESGYKVAIAEQMEDPKEAKGVVKRDNLNDLPLNNSLGFLGIFHLLRNRYLIA